MRREDLAEGVTLYCGDCREVLPTIGKVDAVVTDPPYGIGADKGQAARANKRHGKALVASKDYGTSDWDAAPPSSDLIGLLLAISRYQIIFGGNYFNLPPSRCWLVWDKLTGDNDYADCELAWTNLDKPVRRIVWLWKGMLRKGADIREHPTQKPEGVMKWSLEQLPPDVVSVCDPFMGSGTTGVAAIARHIGFIGIEADERYFDIACRRIQAALDAPDMFIEQPAPLKQETPALA